jgi:8-oxo-dGTP diphosphatase
VHFLEHFCPERSQIVIVEGQDVGVLRLELGSDEWFLDVLEILPEWQGKGIGTYVIQAMLADASECQKPVALQVLKVNPAKRLYERLGFRKVGETPTHVEMRAWPPRAMGDSPAEVVEKVVAYITQQDQLLVFSHVEHPEAGIQVPAGTLLRGEDPVEAVLREAHEETGLSGLRIIRFLGTRELSALATGSSQPQRRHFFQLATAEEPPLRWRHWETCPGDGSEAVEFELFWVRLHGGFPELNGALDAMLPLLFDQPGSPASARD